MRREFATQTDEQIARTFEPLRRMRMRGVRPIGPVLLTDQWLLANARKYQGFYTVVTKLDDRAGELSPLCGLDVMLWRYASQLDDMAEFALSIVRANPRSLMLAAIERNDVLVQWLVPAVRA